MTYLTKQEILDFKPAGPSPKNPDDAFAPLREALKQNGQMLPGQLGGKNFAIACIALEITQRCNLDCTLCYLSDLAEAVKDVPLFELERRIAMIHSHYGDHTTIQITGGDPTLRSVADLVSIVKAIKVRNMRAAFFTNGIKASRSMLAALAKAGLDDVVFHVDLTQERKGYTSEEQLNNIRLEYINRARGLPLRVLFNTTVYEGNFQEIPDLVSFFCDHADRIEFASFQMQAETGRGILGKRDANLITQQSMMEALRKGTRINLGFDAPMIGHSDCNKYASVLVSGKARAPFFDDLKFTTRLFGALAKVQQNWSDPQIMIKSALALGLRSPSLLWEGLKFWARKAWHLRGGLLKGNGVHRINFFIHNFMDAEKLEPGRCESCVFMVATANGPLSMCVHNAKRDELISQPVRDAGGNVIWNPLGENETADALPLKKLKGRLRMRANIGRRSSRNVNCNGDRMLKLDHTRTGSA